MAGEFDDISPKSYGVAVILAGIFGVLGVHHFYLGRILHGLFDLSLTVGAVIFYIIGGLTGSVTLILIAVALFGTDVIHTIYVFYKLLVGEYNDGYGRLVVVPGQKHIRESHNRSI